MLVPYLAPQSLEAILEKNVQLPLPPGDRQVGQVDQVRQVKLLGVPPPDVGDGDRQQGEQVLGPRQDQAVPVERRTLLNKK